MILPWYEFRDLDPDVRYSMGLKDAKFLYGQNTERKSPNFDDRRNKILSLLKEIFQVVRRDTNSYKALKSEVKGLLIEDPISDQQAGLIARWEFYFFESLINSASIGLTLEEMIELRVGDWKNIELICTSDETRKAAWNRAKAEVFSDNILTVYRGMKLSDSDVSRIKKYGLIPPGLWHYAGLDKVLDRHLWGMLKEGDESYLDRLKDKNRNRDQLLNARLLPISKSVILSNHWQVDSDSWATDTLESLAISTSSDRFTAMRYGSSILQVELPATRMVTRYFEPGLIDISILYYIPPEAIKSFDQVTR